MIEIISCIFLLIGRLGTVKNKLWGWGCNIVGAIGWITASILYLSINETWSLFVIVMGFFSSIMLMIDLYGYFKCKKYKINYVKIDDMDQAITELVELIDSDEFWEQEDESNGC